ncbi:MAG: chloramphenicol resistance protein [Ruminococcus sp.]|nr:chloramphenicol resistance protein [Ruminococcus sp.]
MAIIESIRDFISGCPLLKNGVLLNVDRLGATEIEYTVDGEITRPILRQYTDGSSLRQFEFVFASREKYGADTLQNIANSGFYEDFADWIETQSNTGNLPKLDKYRVPQYIEVLSGGYVFDSDDSTARYQIQLKFVYYQDRRNNNG